MKSEEFTLTPHGYDTHLDSLRPFIRVRTSGYAPSTSCFGLQTIRSIPENLKPSLPTVEEIERKLKQENKLSVSFHIKIHTLTINFCKYEAVILSYFIFDVFKICAHLDCNSSPSRYMSQSSSTNFLVSDTSSASFSYVNAYDS